MIRRTPFEHLRVRQLIAAVVALAIGLALVVADRRAMGGEEGFADGEPTEVPEESSDPDADPFRSLVPFVSSEPQVSTTWFCPGVPGSDSAVSGRVVVANPTDADIAATVSVLGSSAPPVEEAVAVPARGRASVEITGRIRSPFVGAVVEILGTAGSVEQTISHPAGDATVGCARRPSREWHFADGFTGDDSRDSIVITNPYPDAAVVDVTFVTRESGRTPANLKGYVVPARSTVGVSVVDEGARNETVLAVSVRVTAGAVVAGRSQHFLGRGRLGYTMRLGSPGLSGEWWFADGSKTEGVTEQFVVYNPGGSDRTVSLVVLAGSETFLQPLTITAPAGGVTVVDTPTLGEVPAGRYGVVISTLDDRSSDGVEGIVVEQVVTRREGNSTGTSVVLGVPGSSVSTVWSAPSGVTPGLESSLVLLNATPNTSTVRVSQVGPAGPVLIPGLEALEVPAGGVVVLGVPEVLPVAELIVESTEPLVVQRLLARGGTLGGRAAALALPHLPVPRR